MLTVVLAFFVGGLVVVATTGKNPITTYRAIFDGSGLNWLLPWTSDRATAADNLQQTLLLTTTLVLVGLAFAFAARCGVFNIGGPGQYISGSLMAIWIGTSLSSLAAPLHVAIALVCATFAAAALGGLAGWLKARMGVNEVISTIMLNWVVLWIGAYLVGLGGPLQNTSQPSVPVSNDVVASAKLYVFWGSPLLQGLDIGFFVALAALLVYWVVLARTTLGFSIKAVGFNSEAARYGGIPVARSYVTSMAIAGGFAGLAGAVDVLGWQFRLAPSDVLTTQIGFIGIAVALLGRNSATGIGLAALLLGGLLNGTSTRSLDPTVFRPDLAANLSLIIVGLIVLFVGAELIVVWMLGRLRRSP